MLHCNCTEQKTHHPCLKLNWQVYLQGQQVDILIGQKQNKIKAKREKKQLRTNPLSWSQMTSADWIVAGHGARAIRCTRDGHASDVWIISAKTMICTKTKGKANMIEYKQPATMLGY